MIPLLLLLFVGQYDYITRPPFREPEPAAVVSDYAEARRRAKASGVPLVVMLTTDNCVWCERLKSKLKGWHQRRDIAFVIVHRRDRIARDLPAVDAYPVTFCWRDPDDGGTLTRAAGGAYTAAQLEAALLGGRTAAETAGWTAGNVAGICVRVRGQFVGVSPNTLSAWRRHVGEDHGYRNAASMDRQQLAQAHADAHAGRAVHTRRPPQRRWFRGGG